jgi:MFS family permease
MKNDQETATQEGKSQSPFRNRQFLFIFVIAFLVYMSSTMLTLTLPKYANDLGATAQAVGLLAGMFQIAALSMRPISGQIVDNENRLITLRLVLLVILISVFGLALSSKYWMLIVFRALHGLAWGVGSTLFMTIASGCFPSKRMTAGIGVYGLGQVFAQTIAPTFAVPVALRFGYGTLYVGNIVLISICLVIALFMKIRSSKPRLRSYSYNLKKMIYLPATLPATMTMVNSIAKSSIRAFLVIFAATMDIVNIGIFFTVQAVTISVTRPILSKLADRFGLTRILIPCEIFTVAGLVIVSFAHGLAGFLMSECVRSASPDKRVNASNTSYVGTDIGGFVGSNLAGIAVAYLGYRYMYRVFALPVIVLTVIYTILQARRQRALDAEAIQDGIAS